MKTQSSTLFTVLALLTFSTFDAALSTTFAQGTAFTYQGRLDDGGAPANGLYDLDFYLRDAANGGNPVGSTNTVSAVSVTNGQFVAVLDFGNGIFTGVDRWLEIAVRTNGGGNFTALTPRQKWTPAPYAIFANTASNLSGTLPVSQLNGPVGNGQLAFNSFAFNYGPGITGDGSVTLGGSATLNNTGVLSITGNADITASPASGAVTLIDTATSADTANRIVKRDANGSFSAASIALDNNLNLPPTTATAGIIMSGGNAVLHSFGTENIFIGVDAGNFTMTGNDNSATGFNALFQNTSGNNNTANGAYALRSNTSGLNNTASGYQALSANTIGMYDTANGAQALLSNTNGSSDTANGFDALSSNTSGSNNTAIGASALFENTSGGENVAEGHNALFNNTNGVNNTASGNNSLIGNTMGSYNTADGYGALTFNTSGSNNIALGYQAGMNITTGSSNIDIGYPGSSTDSNFIHIGTNQTKTFIAGIFNAGVTGPTVQVNAGGQLGVATSSARFKDNIQSMKDVSDVLLSLRPVTFQYKPDIDPTGIPQFGLIAEEVEKVDPDLVWRDAKNQIYTVRYEAVNAMLLNEFLKEHHKVETQSVKLQELSQKVDAQNSENAALQQRLEALERILLKQKSN